MRRQQIWIFLVWTMVGVVSACAQDVDWDAYQGRVITNVTVVSTEVFDPKTPGEDLRILGWANALHIVTREGVIRRELLFAEGEPLDPLLVQETERNLRRLGIFQDASIRPEDGPDGLTLRIRTADRWATKLITDLSSEGSITSLRLGLENTNFLGRAKRFGGTVEASSDVDALNLFLLDPRVLGSRWSLSAGYFKTDLAEGQRLGISYPFFSESSRWGGAYSHNGSSGDRRVFYSGGDADSLHVDERRNEGFVARQFGGTILQRVALSASQQRLSGDVLQHRATVAVSYALMQRHHRALRRVDLFGVSEDIAAGWTVQVLAGMDMQALGADVDRPAWRIDGSVSWFVGRGGFFGLQTRHHGFSQNGSLQNSRTVSEAWGFWKTKRQTLAWSLGGAIYEEEQPYVRMAFGGDTRLRGYPARHQTGTRSLWLNVEERLFTPMRVFFLHVGAAVFLDVAQAWDAPQSATWRSFDFGTGGGIRIGNNKSGSGAVRLDAAYGRDGWGFSLASASFVRVARGLVFPSTSLFR